MYVAVLGISLYTAGLGVSTVAAAQSVHKGTQQTHKMTRRDHRIRLQSRLGQAVRDATLTTSQKIAFSSELKTLHQERHQDLSKQSTKVERQAEHAKLMSQLQAWAKSSNFPLAKIFPKLAG